MGKLELFFWFSLIGFYSIVVYSSGMQSSANRGAGRQAGAARQQQLSRPEARVRRNDTDKPSVFYVSTKVSGRALAQSMNSLYISSGFFAAEVSEHDREELVRLATSDPRRALSKIRALPPQDRERPQVKLIKIVAIGNILWERADQIIDREGVSFQDVQSVFNAHSDEERGLAVEALQDMRAIERRIARFFTAEELVVPASNRVCIPAEVHNPGRTQTILGWTKLFYFRFNSRLFTVTGNSGDEGRLRDLPSESLLKILNVPVSTDDIVRSVCLAGADLADGAWIGFFFLGRKSGMEGPKISHMDPFAAVAISEEGRYQVEYISEESAGSTDHRLILTQTKAPGGIFLLKR